MAIEFRCETCGKLLRTGEENSGRPAACPGCGDRISVPFQPPQQSRSSTVANSDFVAPGKLQRHRPQAHRGGLILAFGILSWATCFLFGVAAWAMGVEDLRAMRAGEMDASGEGLTRAGMILGAINVVLAIVALLGMIAITGIAVILDS